MTILALAFSSVAFVHALLWLLLFFIIGLIIGWVLWHKCREEALAAERENERLKQDQERLEREIREIREEIGAAA